MQDGKGGFFITFEPVRRQVLQRSAAALDRFSIELSALDWEVGRKEMFLMNFSDSRESVSCAALGRRKAGPKNTGGQNVEFSGFVFFDSIALSVLLEQLPGSARGTIKTREGSRGKWFPPVAWRALLTALGKERPRVQDQINQLWVRVNAADEFEQGANVQKLAFQRDAIGLSFEIAGLSDKRRHEFRKIQINAQNQSSSFIELMDVQPPQERALIDHDRNVFESVISKGECHSARFSEGFRNLRVWTVDKSRIEQFTGVDLVILNQDYNSMLLLQYKCMEHEFGKNGRQWRYRPDRAFEPELRRMESIKDLIERHNPSAPRMEDLRLDSSALYFKFCKRLPLSQQDGDLAEGMLMSLFGTKAFLGSESGKGPQGGRYIGYDNCERYFNNSLFAALARDGWIGSTGLSDQHYQEILGLIQEQDDRSLVLAESQTVVPDGSGKAFRRTR